MKKLFIIISFLFILTSLLGCKEKTIQKLNELVKEVVITCPKEKTTLIENIKKDDFIFSNIPKGYVLEKQIIGPNLRDNRYSIVYKLTTKRKKYFSKEYRKSFTGFLIPESEKQLIEDEISKIEKAGLKLIRWNNEGKKEELTPENISFKDKNLIKNSIVIDNYNKKKYILRKQAVVFDEEKKEIRLTICLVYRTNLVSREIELSKKGFKD